LLSGGATGDDESRPTRWLVLFGSMAAWEVFLRLDSRVLSVPTKLWLFALLAVSLVAGGALLVRGVALLARAVLGDTSIRALARLGFACAAALIVGVEYALLTFHHPVAPLRYAPAVAAAAAALAYGVARPSADARSVHAGRRWAPSLTALVLVAVSSLTVFAAALRRPDVGAALIKRNSAVGRVLGHTLAIFPPRLPAPSGSVLRAPDLPAARVLGRGSVIILTIDALRADALGVYNHVAGTTPVLERFAADGLVFEDAYAQVPSSAPSIASAMTGRYPAHHGLRENRIALPFDETTLAETLTAAGYATAAFVTNPNFAPSFRLDQGFATFHYFPSSAFEERMLLDATDDSAIDAGLAWLGSVPGRPVFLWVHVMAPHSPYVPPADLRPEIHPGAGPWFNVWNMGGESFVERHRAYFDRGVYATLYAAEVRSADRLTGRLLDGLAALGRERDTHVLIFADHGEAFGENDVFAHGRSIDPAESHVPLLWRLPANARAGQRVPTTVQLVDFVPTLLPLLGIARPPGIDGRDLSALVLGEAAPDDGFAFTQARFLYSMGVRGLLYAVRTRTRTVWVDAGYPYDGEFDRTLDPGERWLRSYTARGDDPLRNTLLGLAHAAQESLHPHAPATEVDGAELERLRALGYVQ
jgi:arylsulfatase A-like enzyme